MALVTLVGVRFSWPVHYFCFKVLRSLILSVLDAKEEDKKKDEKKEEKKEEKESSWIGGMNKKNYNKLILGRKCRPFSHTPSSMLLADKCKKLLLSLVLDWRRCVQFYDLCDLSLA